MLARQPRALLRIACPLVPASLDFVCFSRGVLDRISGAVSGEFLLNFYFCKCHHIFDN